jgi:hypothetical protein
MIENDVGGYIFLMDSLPVNWVLSTKRSLPFLVTTVICNEAAKLMQVLFVEW